VADPRDEEKARVNGHSSLGSPFLWIGAALIGLVVIKLIPPPAPIANVLTTGEFVSILRQQAQQVQFRRRARGENDGCNGIARMLVRETLEEIIERTVQTALMRSDQIVVQAYNEHSQCRRTYTRSRSWSFEELHRGVR